MSIASIGPLPDGLGDRDDECEDENGGADGGSGGHEPNAEDEREETGGERAGGDSDPENAERRPVLPE